MRTEVKVEAYMFPVTVKGRTAHVERFRIVEKPTGKILEAGIMSHQDAMARALRKAARPNAAHAAKIKRRDVRRRVVRNLAATTFVNVGQALAMDSDPQYRSLSPLLSREEHQAFDAFPLAVRAADEKMTPEYHYRAMDCAPRSSTWGAR